TRIWSPRPGPLFKDVSAGRGGGIEASASQFGVVVQEHQNTRQTQAPITRTRAASRGGFLFMDAFASLRQLSSGFWRSFRRLEKKSEPHAGKQSVDTNHFIAVPWKREPGPGEPVLGRSRGGGLQA